MPSPVLTAPMAALGLAHPNGEAAVALAAAALGAGFVLSAQSSRAHAQVADLVRDDPARGPLWQQLHLQADEALNLALAEDAAKAGFEAVVVTVDAPMQGVRDRQLEAGFRMPPHALSDWRYQPALPCDGGPAPGGLCAGWGDAAATWDTLQALLAVSPLPVLLKGVTHPADARLAWEIGCHGLIVSNHGGRNLDTVPATAVLLPAIAATKPTHGALLVDGGIRRGTDIVKALASGADAVLVGRPVAAGLASNGAAGVAQVLRGLLDELEIAMTLCGCRTLADIGPEQLGMPAQPR